MKVLSAAKLTLTVTLSVVMKQRLALEVVVEIRSSVLLILRIRL